MTLENRREGSLIKFSPPVSTSLSQAGRLASPRPGVADLGEVARDLLLDGDVPGGDLEAHPADLDAAQVPPFRSRAVRGGRPLGLAGERGG